MFQSIEGIETEIEANTGFERHWSRAQTGLQTVIAGVVVAGLAGVFGNGWLSTDTRSFAHEPVTLTYQRLLRANAPTDVVVRVDRPLPTEFLILDVGAEFLAQVSIGTTEPGASAIEATPQGARYTFHLGPERRGSLTLRLSPRRVGPVRASFTVQGDRLDLPLFVYP